MRRTSASAFVKHLIDDQSFREKACVAFKFGLSVSIGTLLSLIPGYSGLWYSPVSLADQVIFTILGGANLTVGGATEQIFWRLLIGALFGAGAFSLLGVLGGSAVAQGIVFFLLVFVFTLVRANVPKADIGLTFATLACVYAVDYSFRIGSGYMVDTEALKDLLRAWAFGAAISLAVNFLILPIKASHLASTSTTSTLRRMRNITAWLLAEGRGFDSEETFTPAAVRRALYADENVLTKLENELGWEIGWSSSTLNQRIELLKSVKTLQCDMINAARNGPFVSDLPEDLASIVRPAVSLFADWALHSFDNIILASRAHRPVIKDGEGSPAFVNMAHARVVFEKAAGEVTSEIISALRSGLCTPERIAGLDRATHCLDVAVTLTNDLARLEILAMAAHHRKRRLRPYIIHNLLRIVKMRSRNPRQESNPSPMLGMPTTAFIPPLSWTQRFLAILFSTPSKFPFKVSGALCCLLAILWAPTSREFYLNYGVRTSTVPLLLALTPTLGLSVISWLGQLSGAAVGVLWGCLILRICGSYGQQSHCLPAIFFLEWLLGLVVGHRMANGPDFFAVTSMNACAIFINVQWQLAGTPGEQSLGLHLGYMLTTSAIAIALAIPFQLLIFPQHARDYLRTTTAKTLLRLSRLSLAEVELSGQVLFSHDDEGIVAKATLLSGEVESIRASLRNQDNLVDLAAAEWGRGHFHPKRDRAIIEALHRCADTMAAHIGLCLLGPVDSRIRELLRVNNSPIATAFGEACSLTYWCLGASWTMLDSPYAPLPSTEKAGSDLMRELERPEDRTNPAWIQEDTEAQKSVRRWWSLTLTLVTQHQEIAALTRIMGPDWEAEHHHAKYREERNPAIFKLITRIRGDEKVDQ